MTVFLVYLVSSFAVLSLTFGIMCLVKLFKKELSKAYVKSRLKLLLGVLAFIVFIFYPVSEICSMIDFYSFPLGLRFCLCVDAFAVFVLVIFLFMRWDKKEKIDPAWARIRSATESFFTCCQPARFACSDLLEYVKGVYDRYKDGNTSLSFKAPSGRYYSAFVSDPILFSLISVAQFADRYELAGLSEYAVSKLYVAEDVDQNRRLSRIR